MPKQRIHCLTVKVRFDKAVGARAAASLFRNYVSDHYYCSEWGDDAPEEFRIKGVQPAAAPIQRGGQ